MNQPPDPGRPVVKRIANICAFAALVPLITLAEWIPGLLPRSPNLAYSHVFWLSLLTILLYFALKLEAPDYRFILGLAVLVTLPIVLSHALLANWKAALRSNSST